MQKLLTGLLLRRSPASLISLKANGEPGEKAVDNLFLDWPRIVSFARLPRLRVPLAQVHTSILQYKVPEFTRLVLSVVKSHLSCLSVHGYHGGVVVDLTSG